MTNEFNVARYWDERHDSSSPLTAGGDKGLSDEENTEFYAIRLGLALGIMHRVCGRKRPLRVLDAGCGNGQLTGPIRDCGHVVVGVDASPAAIRHARETWPRATFVEAPLETLALGRLFDVVLAVDVLFHLVDDTAWRAALTRLAAHVRATGALVVTDTWRDDRFALGNYIIHRSSAEYDDVLAPLGWRRTEVVPYDYGGNPNGFAVFERAAA